MGFETKALAVVAKTLDNPHLASFSWGTLGVLCSEAEAWEVLRDLREEGFPAKLSGPLMGSGEPEYLFDF